jgi:hypothetical protein
LIHPAILRRAHIGCARPRCIAASGQESLERKVRCFRRVEILPVGKRSEYRPARKELMTAALGAVVVAAAWNKAHPKGAIQPHEQPQITPTPRPAHRPSSVCGGD